jgi:hypothetical protein
MQKLRGNSRDGEPKARLNGIGVGHGNGEDRTNTAFELTLASFLIAPFNEDRSSRPQPEYPSYCAFCGFGGSSLI